MESHQNSLLETVPEAHLRDIRLKVAVEVALKVGQMIEEARCRVKSVETKQSFADLVTETDKKVESIIFEELRRKFPEDKFIGEEGVGLAGSEPTKLTDDRTWIVDPIDGKLLSEHDKSNGDLIPALLLFMDVDIAFVLLTRMLHLLSSKLNNHSSRYHELCAQLSTCGSLHRIGI